MARHERRFVVRMTHAERRRGRGTRLVEMRVFLASHIVLVVVNRGGVRFADLCTWTVCFTDTESVCRRVHVLSRTGVYTGWEWLLFACVLVSNARSFDGSRTTDMILDGSSVSLASCQRA